MFRIGRGGYNIYRARTCTHNLLPNVRRFSTWEGKRVEAAQASPDESSGSGGTQAKQYEDLIKSINQREVQNPEMRKMTIVLGCTGQIGMAAAIQGIKNGELVVGTTRRPQTERSTALYREEKTPENFSEWKSLFLKYLPNVDALTVINTIGGAHAPPGKTLFDLNVTPVLYAAQGLMAALEHHSSVEHRFVHASSIAATMLDDAYGETKRASEEALSMILPSLTAMRIGFAVNELKSTGYMTKVIDMEHAYGPEQIARLPVQILFSHDQHLIQPIYIPDIIEAMYCAPFAPGWFVVDAVGREALTTGEFFKFYCDILGRPFRPVFIDYNVAQSLASRFALGHFAPYAIEYCQKLDNGGKIPCHLAFQNLLGRDPRTLPEIYRIQEGERLISVNPPLLMHGKNMMTTCFQDPRAALDLVHGASHITRQVAISLLNGSWTRD